MEAELSHALAVCEAEVLSLIAPLEQVGGWAAEGKTTLAAMLRCWAGLLGWLCSAFGAIVARHALGLGVWVFGERNVLVVAFPTTSMPDAPALQLTAAEVRRLEGAEAQREQLVGSLDRLKQRVANLE